LLCSPTPELSLLPLPAPLPIWPRQRVVHGADLGPVGLAGRSRLRPRLVERLLLLARTRAHLVHVNVVHDGEQPRPQIATPAPEIDRKSTRLNSSHVKISYADFC